MHPEALTAEAKLLVPGLASIRDIAAMKAFAMGKRLSHKDYFDWYCMLTEGHIALGDVIDLAAKKFGPEFNDRLFLGQLVSFSEIPTQKIDYLDKEIDRETIEHYLAKVVEKFTAEKIR